MHASCNFLEKITQIKFLYESWLQFRRGKSKKQDVVEFEQFLEHHLFEIQEELATLTYRHGSYQNFTVCDPKERRISKASVKDRLVHQIVYTALLEIYDKTFIHHSFSNRLKKGTHQGIHYLRGMIRKVSANGTLPCYALKMDIRRFFDSMDHEILKKLIREKIPGNEGIQIVDEVIDSFAIKKGTFPSSPAGVPLGNVTSQFFANIYLHPFDLFIKQTLQERCYLRYCDDFLLLSRDKEHLLHLIPIIQEFLAKELHLELHPKKIILRRVSSGIDFLGYVLFPKHSVLRTRTKKRMKKRLMRAYFSFIKDEIDEKSMDQRLQSYLGILSHTNQHELSLNLLNAYSVRKTLL